MQRRKEEKKLHVVLTAFQRNFLYGTFLFLSYIFLEPKRAYLFPSVSLYTKVTKNKKGNEHNDEFILTAWQIKQQILKIWW